MGNEQEGIEIETIGTDGIIDLPEVQEVETEEQEVPETNTEGTEAVTDDEDKESLKRGINAERKKRKEAERKAKDFEARLKALEEANKKPEKTTLEELVESGVDESIAKSIATAIDKKKGDTSELENQVKELKFNNSLMEKSKEEGFEDILDYADEIKDLVDKGLTIEQSYYATTYNKPKTKDTQSELQRKLEAKMQNNNARKEILGNINSSSVAKVNHSNSSIKATAEEKAIATKAGMTVEEYVAIRDMNSVKDYEGYKTKKK